MRRTVLLLVVAALAAMTTALPAAAAEGSDDVTATGVERSYRYQVTRQGTVYADLEAFRRDVGAILGDARGWTLGGSVRFRHVTSGGDFQVILASPMTVENAAPVCSRYYSCRVGNRVYINDINWRQSTPAFRNAGGGLTTYRQYVINHEVGHYLGFGHHDCTSPGGPARVMQQQSISLQGCQPNGWPTSFERNTLGDRLGVGVYAWVFTDVLYGDVHRDAIHAIARAEIARGYADGTFRPRANLTRAQRATVLARALGLRAERPVAFDDVARDDPHASAIAALHEHGIVSGYDERTFGPGDPVVRGQMATMLAGAYDLHATRDPDFSDVPSGHTHAEGIAAVAESGIAKGFDDGTYRPGARVTRAQMASFITRAHSDR
jgi:hypothetical protein